MSSAASAPLKNISYGAELNRKAIHIASMGIPIFAYFLDRVDSVLILSILFGISLIADIERFRSGFVGDFIRRYFNFMIRPHEKNSKGGMYALTGSTWMLLSAIITFAIFPKPVAVAAFSMLILCDTAAALIGRRYGRIRFGPKQKSVEGTLAFFITGILISLVTPRLPIEAGIVGALVAAIAEALPIPLDDNFSVPLSAGAAMMLVLAI